MNGTTEPGPIQHSESGLGRLVLAVVVAFGLALAWNALRAEPRPEAEPPEPAAPAPAATAPAWETEIAVPAGDVLELSLARHFELVQFEQAASSLPYRETLTRERPPQVRKLPDDLDPRHFFGVLAVGDREDPHFAYVLDAPRAGEPRLFLDRNQNGDLSDDGAPLRNQGSGYFAALLSLPGERVFRLPVTSGDFELWLYTDEKQLERGRASWYSRTQARGRVRLGNATHIAYLVDRGRNDGNLTNDGVYVDLDGDGELDGRTEFFQDGDLIELGPQTLRVAIGP